MHYLKCNNCGHYNEVKSEYMVFCANCNKKLNNSFSEWVKRNPEKSFDDYKQVVCTTEKAEIKEQKPKSKKVKSLKYWIGFAVAFAIFYAIGQIGGEKIVDLFRKPLIDRVLMKTASEINKTCPVMVDQYTRLDNAVVLPDKVFQFNYTLLNIDTESVNINELKKNLEPSIINYVRTSPQIQKLRDEKVTINYNYRNDSGAYLFTISVKPEDYEK
ncbi:MAG: hypothetical protein JXR65_11445 [Bacteroidales bacterium]|nr:hypothetical protein [Bacteroidales bacterium]